MKLEFELDPLRVSLNSWWIHILIRKEIEIEYLYAQNDERVNEKLTLKSAPMEMEKLEKGSKETLVPHGKEMNQKIHHIDMQLLIQSRLRCLQD